MTPGTSRTRSPSAPPRSANWAGWRTASPTAPPGQRLRELTGVAFDEAFSLAVLGMVHRRRREPRQARQALEGALAALDDGPHRPPLRAWILAELARVRAADDLSAARDLAERAVTVAREPDRPYALLARGWVALLRGDTVRAHHDAAEARTGATVGRRRATLVQALQLTVLAAADPRAAAGLLDDAAALCQELGDRAEEAAVRLIAARLQGRQARRGAEGAEQKLRRCGVRLDPGVADALTAITLRVPAVVIHTLGDFRVFRAGAVVPFGEWQSKKARDLLKILVAHRGRAVPRSRLMELLWPDESPSRTANRLSVLLSTLRRVLGTGQRPADAGPCWPTGARWRSTWTWSTWTWSRSSPPRRRRRPRSAPGIRTRPGC